MFCHTLHGKSVVRCVEGSRRGATEAKREAQPRASIMAEGEAPGVAIS